MCDKLDRYKGAFAVFPSQSLYTSVLCGGLSLIVTAAVNNRDIAELLSEAVADIADKASHAAKLLLIYPSSSTLSRLFAGLYAHVFLFYRDIIQWYTESKRVRAFKSFDAGLKERYQKSRARIEDCLSEIYRVAGVAHVAETSFRLEVLEEKCDRMSQLVVDGFNQMLAGQAAQRTLEAMVASAAVERRIESPRPVCFGELMVIETPSIDPGYVDRAHARKLGRTLSSLIVGTRGPALLQEGRFWVPDGDISIKLGDWIGSTGEGPTLWIYSPVISRGFSSSRAAALVAAVSAWDAELPIISHFCARPRSADLDAGRTQEEAGMIGLVYSLLTQLLDFEVEQDAFQAPSDQLAKLDGSDASWPEALGLLMKLLRTTPQVQRCIIDGLNDMCFSSGGGWCSAFLAVLFEHQRTSIHGFKILLTTTGSSRVLPDFVEAKDKVLIQRAAKEVVRGGKWVDAAPK